MKKEEIGIYGLKGSYTDLALKEIFKKEKINPKNFYFSFIPNSLDLMDFVQKGNIAIVPIENSTAGTVIQFLDIFPKYNFEIIYEYYMPINHALLGNKKSAITDIKKIYSHPQSILQSLKFLRKNKIEAIDYIDNSAAAQYVANLKKNNIGAIGSEILTQIYDLKILKKKIQDNKNNTTRFLIIKKEDTKNSLEKKIKKKRKKKKSSIIFKTKDMTGLLYKSLGAFATQNINLTKIESRPSQEKNFDYFFFLEFEGDLKSKKIKTALKELEFFTEKIQFLGSY